MPGILLVSLTPAYGGGEIYLEQLAQALLPDRRVLALCNHPLLAENLKRLGVEVRFTGPQFYRRWPWLVSEIVHWARQAGVTHVHLNGEREIYLQEGLRFWGFRLTSTRHTSLYPAHRWKFRLKNQVAIRGINQIERTICVSESLREQLIESGAEPERLVTIHNAVHEAYLQVPPQVRRSARFKVAIVARFDPIKGHQVFFEAGAGLEGLEVRLIGTGDPRLFKIPPGLPVEFYGAVSTPHAMIEALAGTDAVALPSFSEGCPLSLLEAMALGKAVIASDLPSLRELLISGQEGVLVKAGAPALWRSALVSLRDSPAWCEALGSRARARVERQFTRQLWQARTLTVLNEGPA